MSRESPMSAGRPPRWSSGVAGRVRGGVRAGQRGRGSTSSQLPGEAKLRTTVSVLVGDRALSVSAFVVRRPDENHEEFYRWLLTRNAAAAGRRVRRSTALGDVYLVGRLPLDGGHRADVSTSCSARC